MVIRTLALAGGLAGALASAQFPAFSQQYLQRLGGAVDELSTVVDTFDASAQAAGLTRDQALEALTGSTLLDLRRYDMQQTIVRHDLLSDDLATLQGHGPFMRAYYAARLTDTGVAQRALENFEPALPTTFDGAVFAGAGFVTGALLLRTLLGLLIWPFRRRKLA